jgi:eukaryotic-like serine/threonine-protein kinase
MEYRRGNDAKAAEWSRRCLANPENNAPRIAFVRIVLAMSCHHLGQISEATSELDQAGKAIEARFKDGLDSAASSQYFWYDWIFARVLLREANVLFGEAPTAVNSSPSVK